MPYSSAMAGPIWAWGARGGAMIEIKQRWWVWLLIILVIYVTVRSPTDGKYVFGGLVHGFAAVGNAIVRVINDLRSPPH
jgi:hypothetical protein